MLHTFEPRYVLPDRKAITNHYIPEMYECEKRKIMNAMEHGLEYCALTTDGWTPGENNRTAAASMCNIN